MFSFGYLAPLKSPRPGDMRSTDLRAAHGVFKDSIGALYVALELIESLP